MKPKCQRARSLEHTTGLTITLLKNRVCGTSHCPDTSSNLATAPSLDVLGLCNLHVCTVRLVRTCLHHDVYIEDSDDERHMWKLGRLLHLLEHWHLLLCHNEHVYHSISLLALVDLHRLSICLDGWYLVLLHNWDIDDRDVLDQRDWCLLHLWHIDNFVDGLCLSLHWTSITLSMNCT